MVDPLKNFQKLRARMERESFRDAYKTKKARRNKDYEEEFDKGRPVPGRASNYNDESNTDLLQSDAASTIEQGKQGVISLSSAGSKASSLSTAYELMRKGVREGRADYALMGARVYDAVSPGISYSVQKRLVKAVENEYAYRGKVRHETLKRVEEFLKGHPPRRRDLSEKVGVTVSVLLVLAGIFQISLNMTGNVISQNSSNLVNTTGAFLLIAGLVGIFISLRSKN